MPQPADRSLFETQFAPRPPGASREPVRVALGVMNFGKRTPEPEARRVVDRAIERGVRVFDTANVYENGESERILGRALGKRREDVLVATKVGLGRDGGARERLTAARIVKALDESLARLGTERVDLYYLHAPDHDTPIDDTLDGVEAALGSGKALAWGVSNYASWQVLELQHFANARSIEGPRVAQLLYNLLIRELDVEWSRFARSHALHTTVYNALAGGLLAGTVREGEAPPVGSRFERNVMYRGRYLSARFFDAAREYQELATRLDRSLIELAYAFLAASPVVDSVLVGPGSVEQLDAALDGLAKPLTEDELRQVDALDRALRGTDTHYAR